MKIRLKFPIRFKILIALLLIVTTVVSIITFTMANLFHADKSAYVHDLTSEMAMHSASETRALLAGYRERLQVFARLLLERDLLPNYKSKLLTQLFEDFHEFVAITLYMDGTQPTSVYDARSLESMGLTKEAFFKKINQKPIPFKQIKKGTEYIANSTINKKMPTFTLAIAYPVPSGGGEKAVVAAVIRLEGLQRLAERSKVFTTFIADFKGRPLAHTDQQMVIGRKPISWVAGIKGLQGTKVHGSTHEYVENGNEMVGGLAGIEGSELIAGVQIPKRAAYLTARALLNNLIVVALVLLVSAALIGLLGSRLLTRPIERLSDATQVVAKGRFNIQVNASSRDEIGELATSFNQMATELDSREKALKSAQAALVQSEKMAAFGQLGAGIAHEIKNPLAGILGLAQLSMRKLNKDTSLHKNMTIIEKETNRCTTIIQNLLKFARQEKVDYQAIDLNQVADDATAIVEHQLEMNKVKLKRDLQASLPKISGNANQIQQVLINLMINAQQAMEGTPGEVAVTTAADRNGHVEVRVSDDGPGIPEELRAKIFEPFFTTKAVGKGTGLGLSVSYGIIKEHKGEITVESTPGTGTTFVLKFPVMAMKSRCPHCRISFNIQPSHVGLKNKCKNCGKIFEIKELG
jgi:two-component system NtrC family sensor kinase